MPSDQVPGSAGECPSEAGRLRLQAGLRALPGKIQDALQTNMASLERTSKVSSSPAGRPSAFEVVLGVAWVCPCL